MALFLFLLWSSINITIRVSAWVEIDQKFPLELCPLWKCEGAVASNSCANFMASPLQMKVQFSHKYYHSRVDFVVFLCV